MREFNVYIELGNDAMKTPHDIADAVYKIANSLQGGSPAGRVMDINGNTVGHWGIDTPEEES